MPFNYLPHAEQSRHRYLYLIIETSVVQANDQMDVSNIETKHALPVACARSVGSGLTSAGGKKLVI
jgi:hypothetical protein